MKWQIKKIDVAENDKLQLLLSKGWEPFAVTVDHTDFYQIEYVWLKRGT